MAGVRIATAATLAALIVGLGFSRAARAGDSAEAEALIRQGVELREQGRDERALPLFQKAYEILPSPRTAGQLGLAESATGYWIEAEQHLGIALESLDHPWIVKNRRALEDALGAVRQHLGELVIEGEPAGAAVTVNHRPIGQLPLGKPVRVANGKVVVEVSAPGYVTDAETVTVAGGGSQPVTIALKPVAAPVLVPAAPPPIVEQQKSQGDHGGLRRRLGWGAAIGAGVFLVAAIIETVVWQGKRSDFNSHLGPPAGNPQLAQSQWQPNCGESDPGRGGPGCSSLYDSAQTAKVISIVGYATAGALATGAAVLLLTGRRDRERRSQIACGANLAPAAVTCGITF
jgi:hypothetical protein